MVTRDELSDDFRDEGMSETDFDFCLSIVISEVHFHSLSCPADFLWQAPENPSSPLSLQDLTNLISTELRKQSLRGTNMSAVVSSS